MLDILETITDSVATVYLILTDPKPSPEALANALAATQALQCSISALNEGVKITMHSPAVRQEAKDALGRMAKFMCEGIEALIKVAGDVASGVSKAEGAVMASANGAVLKTLNGVSCLLVLQDQLSIITIGSCASQVLAINDKLAKVETGSELDELADQAMSIHETFIRRVEHRAQSYQRDSYERRELDAAVELLQAAGPGHVYSVRDRLNHSKTQALAESSKDSAALVDDAVDRIMVIMCSDFRRNDGVLFGVCPLRPPETVREARMREAVLKVAISLSLIFPTASTGGDVNEALRIFKEDINHMVTVARSYSVDSSNSVRHEIIDKCCQSITDLVPKIVKVANEHARSPTSKVTGQMLKGLVMYARGLGNILFSAVQDIMLMNKCKASFVAVISRCCASFSMFWKLSDPKCTNLGCDLLSSSIVSFCAVLESVTRIEMDKAMSEANTFVAARLSALREEFVAKCSSLSASTADESLKTTVLQLVNEISSTAMILVPPHEYAYALWKMMSEDEDELVDSLNRKAPNYQTECVQHVRNAASALKEIVLVIDGMQSSISAPRYQILKDSSDAASTQIGKLVEATKSAFFAKGAEDAMETLRSAVAQSRGSSEDCVYLMTPSLEETILYWSRMRDYMEKNGAESSIPPSGEDQFAAFAARLEKNIPTPANNTEHTRIVTLCKAIASKLSAMAANASGSTKLKVIDGSRAVCGEMVELVRLAQAIATKSRDPCRRREVTVAIGVARFYAVMLKLSSVAFACSSVKQPLIMSANHLSAALTTISFVGSS